MYSCSFAYFELTSAMFYMLYNSSARAVAKIFVGKASAGLLLSVIFVISVLFDISAEDFSFSVTEFTLSVLLTFSRMVSTVVTSNNLLAAPPMPRKAWMLDPNYARCTLSGSCWWPLLCLW